MIAIVDYGVGNLFSLSRSLERVGQAVEISGDPDVLGSAQRLILPGVGAFGDAAEKLRHTKLDQVIVDRAKAGVPILGICLGMQLLFDESLEFGRHRGLGLIPGQIRPISEIIDPALKIPHIGWNALSFPARRHPLFREVHAGEHVYFVHSFSAMNCAAHVIAETEYSCPITAAAANQNVLGCQFHPEKSGETGLKILKAFCETEVWS